MRPSESGKDVESTSTITAEKLAAQFGIEREPDILVTVRRDWLKERGLHENNLVLLPVSGRGMEPTLHDGDIAMVNLADTTPVDGAVFLVKAAGDFVVRRLVRLRGAWRVHRDNPDQHRYPSSQMEDGDEVIGRVIMRVSTNV